MFFQCHHKYSSDKGVIIQLENILRNPKFETFDDDCLYLLFATFMGSNGPKAQSLSGMIFEFFFIHCSANGIRHLEFDNDKPKKLIDNIYRAYKNMKDDPNLLLDTDEGNNAMRRYLIFHSNYWRKYFSSLNVPPVNTRRTYDM